MRGDSRLALMPIECRLAPFKTENSLSFQEGTTRDKVSEGTTGPGRRRGCRNPSCTSPCQLQFTGGRENGKPEELPSRRAR